MLDLILRNCNIIDGVSENIFLADIGILENVIVKIGDLRDYKAIKEIDCFGYYVSPGFIDVHSHSDYNAFIEDGFESKIRQGVTTEIIGNCGYSVYPLYGEFYEKVKEELNEYDITCDWVDLNGYINAIKARGKLKLNLVPLVGLSAIRASICGYSACKPKTSEIIKMQELIDKTFNDGAFGISSGMIYPPCCYFETDEIIELLKPISKYNPIYTTHLRSEGNELLEAITEAITIAKKTNISLQISHLKTNEKHNWHKIDSVFKIIEDAISDGVNVNADRYPYIASQTSLDMVLPKWVFNMGNDMTLRRISDPLLSLNIKSEILKMHPLESDYWENIIISKVSNQSLIKFEGMNLKQVYNILKSDQLNCQKFDIIDCLFHILKKDNLKTSAIFFNMCEQNMDKIIEKPYVMIGSDAMARSITGPLANGKPHPRAFGTFVKFLTDYVKVKKKFSLPKAISKITSLPAKKFNIPNRGRIAITYFADLVIFDFNKLFDNSNFNYPLSYPDGIIYVIVNGKVVYSKFEGSLNVFPGEVIVKEIVS